MRSILIGTIKEIPKGKSKKFSVRLGKEDQEGFVINYKGNFFAYLNRCCHISLPLDWGDNDFFSEDQKFLICKNHGALYQPDSGECVGGPCGGQFLEKVPLKVKKGKIFAGLP